MFCIPMYRYIIIIFTIMIVIIVIVIIGIVIISSIFTITIIIITRIYEYLVNILQLSTIKYVFLIWGYHPEVDGIWIAQRCSHISVRIS